MTKYHIIGYFSFILALLLLLFNFFDSTIGKILFGISVGAGIKFVTDGVLFKSGLLKKNKK